MSDTSLETDDIVRILPDTLANKIAAGEVVQRPASVLKELVENSLDAGADDIQVVLKGAGAELIQVIDNGCGMSRKDVVTCFYRHATSKISSDEDLERIHTLGFRGEALASIGAVSQVELKSRRKGDPMGAGVRVEGGKMGEPMPSATSEGTVISVRNLFFNVPARRNFLKTPATEFKHLLETFQFLALSNPHVGFTLIHDDHEIHRLPPGGSDPQEGLQNRITALFGQKLLDSLVPVSEATSYLSLDGFVGKPEFSRKTRGEQFMFVNGRYVINRYLDHAVLNGYGEMLPKGAFPFFTLFLTLDPRHVDVNVHPTKAEVKFDDDRGVYGFMRAVVKKSLGMADISPDVGYDDGGRLVERSERNLVSPANAEHQFPQGESADHRRDRYHPLRDYERPEHQGDIFRGANTEQTLVALYGAGSQLDLESESAQPGPGHVIASRRNESGVSDDQERSLWQLHEKYILTRIRSGLMILDQHAAHERILYERALRAMEGGFGLSQQLLFPHTLEFLVADLELLKELARDLKALGFDIELFSGRSVVVRGVPTDIRVGNERTILEEVIQQYKSYRDTMQLKGKENLAKSLACRSAIKTGQRLSVVEMHALIDQLFACEMPYACPHGRPTMIKLSIEELDRRFGRTGHLERE